MSINYDHLLNIWTKGLNQEQALLEIYRRVRDIPYQFTATRDVETLLKTNSGTCTAKHILFSEMVHRLGYNTRFIVDEMDLSDLLQGLNREDAVVKNLFQLASDLDNYFHTYTQIMIDSRWVSVDLSFDSTLAPYGFKVSRWDGKNDTGLIHIPIKTYVVEDRPDELKTQMLIDESEENRQLRKMFFNKLNEYMISLRNFPI